MLPYSFTTEWFNGNYHLVTDAVSRFPVDQLSVKDDRCKTHPEVAVKTQISDKFAHDIQPNEVCEHEKKDTQFCRVMECVRSGWPDRLQEAPSVTKSF